MAKYSGRRRRADYAARILRYSERGNRRDGVGSILSALRYERYRSEVPGRQSV